MSDPIDNTSGASKPDSSQAAPVPPTGGTEPARPQGAMPGNPWIYSNMPGGAGGYTAPVAGPGRSVTGAGDAVAGKPAAPVAPAAASFPAFTPGPSVAGGAARPAAAAPTGDASMASVIDTIEAIIIALIIALTFRAFIVEAFVIPTGSMAPTLLGAHIKVICPSCGYEFDRDASLDFQADVRPDGKGHRILHIGNRDPHAELISNSLVPWDNLPIYCPNCRYPIRAEQLPQYLGTFDVLDDQLGPAVHKVPFIWVNNGDRILVMKYLYSIMPPQRWDVIVFKEPQQARDNYIKRLIGLPNESVEIIGGDVYVAPVVPHDAGTPAPPPNPADQKIARKPDHVQQSVWQLVFDNDYYPVDEGKPRPSMSAEKEHSKLSIPAETPTWTNPWQPANDHWKKGVVMAYEGKEPGSLRFHPLPVRESVGTRDFPLYGLNTLGYNDDIYLSRDPGSELGPLSVVGDLRLETVWTPTTDATDVALTVGRSNNCFRVSWTAAGLALSRFNQETNKFESPLGAAEINAVEPARKGHAYHLALNNVDHAVHFYIDGKQVVSYEPEWTARDALREVQLDPSVPDRSNAMISVDVGGPALVGHLKLFRDLYYTQVRGDLPGTATTGKALSLGADEFFAMGDNSRRSSDGRVWGSVFSALDDLALRQGIVPRRYLLGKAFFVYWPAGFRPSTNIPVLSNVPIVPDVGDMRLIR